ncbi:hypothetical protein ACFQ88_02625 [Paenibacillus sp. NPDC056579]|uniref:hypothetical protein n=1 Tax=unclassified Paenibacillus TaxID=185978 RepID=UPI001EF7F48D|nr:hypothetical protein [Paenibacillus sp. H1-7]ULL15924.1 hypothetical protein DVH26_16630 [Paenibacillus sp. H1-7]
MNATEKEMNLISDYILLPIVISIVNKNRLEMETSTAMLRNLYASAAEIVMNRMREDLNAVRLQLKELNICVIDSVETRDHDSVHYPYLLRGQSGRFTIRKEAVKAEVGRRLSRYITEVIKPEVVVHD